VLSGAHAGTVRWWRPGKRSHRVWWRAGFNVEALAISDDGGRVAVAGGRRAVWLSARAKVLADLEEIVVSNLAIAPDAANVLLSTPDGALLVWTPESGALRPLMGERPTTGFKGAGGHRGDGASCFLDADHALVAHAAGVAEVVQWRTGTVVAAMPFEHPPVSVASAGSTILVGDRGGDVHCLRWIA
jgi:hypothetical protein